MGGNILVELHDFIESRDSGGEVVRRRKIAGVGGGEGGGGKKEVEKEVEKEQEREQV